MTRLFVDDVSPNESIIRLDRQNSHYLTKVLRLTDNDRVTVFDGSGREYICSLSFLEEVPFLKVIETLRSDRVPYKKIVILQGLLKGKKMDLLVQKLSETGVSEVIPVITERSQVRSTSKTERWTKIAKESSRQCGRTDVLEISGPLKFEEAVDRISDRYQSSLKIVFYEGGGGTLSSLETDISSSEEVVVFIGPEGGFSEHEIGILRNSGFHIVGLAGFILRAETASIVASGIIQYIISK
ncbi:MAG: 16S rRNA (uracil(1498)-N(3))-methyltransferase [Nitrospirota bacterium]|nr:MAG: 16S rRNA (uracil(1498)-N(3))-methyltransferase [Nitrospirota bacterium]